MNRVAKAISSVEIVGSSSLVSPENVFRAPRQAYEPNYFQDRSHEKQKTRALRQLEKLTGGPRQSYAVKLGGDKLNYAARSKAPSSAIKVVPGEHVPADFYSPEWVEHSERVKEWEQVRATKSSLLMWFEMTTEGKASKAIVDRLAEQLKASQENVRELAITGTDQEYSAAVQAAQNNAEHLKAAEEKHFEKGSAKHLLAKPKDPNNTAKVVSSVLDAMIKPGEHIAARQTPLELRKINVDKNGQVTGKGADRIRTTEGDIALAEPIEVSAEDLAADKKDQAERFIQKTNDGELARLRQSEDRIEFLAGEVARLEKEKAEHGLGKNQVQDLNRLTRELKAAQTRLAGKLDPIVHAVKVHGIRVITDKPASKKVATQVCAKHQGSLSCQCHRETMVDQSRGIVKRAAR
jgi:hypothetical protein